MNYKKISDLAETIVHETGPYEIIAEELGPAVWDYRRLWEQAQSSFVKNKKNIEELDDFFVTASPDDNTNSIGVCYRALYQQKNEVFGRRFDNVYFGPDIDDSEIESVIRKNNLSQLCSISENADAEFVADKLAAGIVTGRCSGRMEFGARALGNRSILADPRNLEVVSRINRIIKKRDFWMPFAPVIIDSYWDKYLINPQNVYSPYMTVGFETTAAGRKAMPAACHNADMTTRPQMLRRKENEKYYDIVKKFSEMTGVGAILNTSFNLHGLPIVRNAADAVYVFLNSDLDAVLLNDTYIEKKEKVRL